MPIALACLIAAGAVVLTGGPAPGATPTPVAPVAAAVCSGCHGAHGEGNAAAVIPRLAAQSAEYLEKQLRDYASGARVHPVMQNFAKPLTDVDRAAVAGYYAALETPYAKTPPTATAGQLARGHQLAHQGAEAKRVQACNNCHGPDGMGVLHSAPYLGGQSAGYLASALKSWQLGTRKNDAGKLMTSVAQQLDDADITGVAAYYASLEN